MTESSVPAGPPHLIPVRSSRGFAAYPPIHCERGDELEVRESSSAEGAFLWIGEKHVSAEEAWRFAEQLRQAVSGHYQGDARPAWVFERPAAGDWVRWCGPIVKLNPDQPGNVDTNPFLDPGSLYLVHAVIPPDYRGNASDIAPKLRLGSTADSFFVVEDRQVELVWRP